MKKEVAHAFRFREDGRRLKAVHGRLVSEVPFGVPALKAVLLVGAGGKSPVIGLRVSAEKREHGWYRGSTAFVPDRGTDAVFLRPEIDRMER